MQIQNSGSANTRVNKGMSRRDWLFGAGAAGLAGLSALLGGCTGGTSGPAPVVGGGGGMADPNPEVVAPAQGKKGMSLAVGLNKVHGPSYGGWEGPLVACEFDANDMTQIADANGFQTTKLLTPAATREATLAEIRRASAALNSGDIFMLSYSGHGGQLTDFTSDEFDAKDETWCLYDGELIDDELEAEWKKFKPGVRILVFSDSCHSGTVVKVRQYGSMPGRQRPGAPTTAPAPKRLRHMPADVAANVDNTRRDFYRQIQERVKASQGKRDDLKATVLLISGCQDNQLSSDGDENGLFTEMLKWVYNNPQRFDGNYIQFHSKILNGMPPYQSPNYYVIGAPNPSFERQKVFTI